MVRYTPTTKASMNGKSRMIGEGYVLFQAPEASLEEPDQLKHRQGMRIYIAGVDLFFNRRAFFFVCF